MPAELGPAGERLVAGSALKGALGLMDAQHVQLQVALANKPSTTMLALGLPVVEVLATDVQPEALAGRVRFGAGRAHVDLGGLGLLGR